MLPVNSTVQWIVVPCGAPWLQFLAFNASPGIHDMPLPKSPYPHRAPSGLQRKPVAEISSLHVDQHHHSRAQQHRVHVAFHIDAAPLTDEQVFFMTGAMQSAVPDSQIDALQKAFLGELSTASDEPGSQGLSTSLCSGLFRLHYSAHCTSGSCLAYNLANSNSHCGTIA